MDIENEIDKIKMSFEFLLNQNRELKEENTELKKKLSFMDIELDRIKYKYDEKI